MSTPLAAVVAIAVLGAAGLAPTVALVGLRLPAALLAPLAGAVLAGAAAAGCLALGGGLLAWFAGLAVTGVVVVLAVRAGSQRARPCSAPGPGVGPSSNRLRAAIAAPEWVVPGPSCGPSRLVAAAGLVVVVGSATVGLLALRAPSVGFDARTIWLLHGVWFAAGHQVALSALRSRALPFAHPTYPPLVGGAVAVSWLVTTEHTYRLGVVVIALLNACAVGAAAWVALEAGVLGRQGARRTWLPSAAAVVVAGGLVLVAFGVAGPFATNGYADLLWSASATGAIGYGLVLPLHRRHVGTAVVLLAVAGLTKDEGIATAMAVVLLMTTRHALARRHRWTVAIGAGLAGVLALGGWPVLVRLLGAPPDQPTLGRRQGSDLSRARAAVTAMVPHLHVVLLALVIAGTAALVLRQARRRIGLGNDVWAWASLFAGTLAVVAAYAAGGGNVEFWLTTSVHRTTFFAALTAWWIVGGWAVVGASAVACTNDGGGSPTDTRPGPAVDAGVPPALDAGVPPVLHHRT